MSSSVSPDSFMSAKALRILEIQGEKMRTNRSRDWIRWEHDICWEAVFRGNIPKPLFLSCFVYLVFGRLILSDPVACKAFWVDSRMQHRVWWSRLCQLLRVLVKPSTVQRHWGIVLVLQLCVKRPGLWNVQLLQTRSAFLARLFWGCPGCVCVWWACCCGN